MRMIKTGVILGSTREGRLGEMVAKWIAAKAATRSELQVELLDLKSYPLAPYPYPNPPKVFEKSYPDEAARNWVAKVNEQDAFIIVTPEYNHGYPAALKNALDHVYAGWNEKAVAFCAYGGLSGGIRAVQQLRQVVIELQMAPVRDEVVIPFIGRAFKDGKPLDEVMEKRADAMLDSFTWWAKVLSEGRKNYPRR